MRKKQVDKGINSVSIGVRFFFVVFVFIMISLAFKAIAIMGKSKYAGQSHFVVSVSNKNDFKILVFLKKPQKIYNLKIGENIEKSNIKSLLGIPIDGEINTHLDIDDVNASNLMGKLLLNYTALKTDLTLIDLIRLYMSVKTMSQTEITEEVIDSFMENKSIDRIVGPMLKDKIIEEENLTIQIINSTNVSGLGNRVGRIISNIGGSVVIITTGNKIEDISTISYSGKKTYTVEKIEKILGFRSNKLEKKGIVDIIIVIGKDSVNNPLFLKQAYSSDSVSGEDFESL